MIWPILKQNNSGRHWETHWIVGCMEPWAQYAVCGRSASSQKHGRGTPALCTSQRNPCGSRSAWEVQNPSTRALVLKLNRARAKTKFWRRCVFMNKPRARSRALVLIVQKKGTRDREKEMFGCVPCSVRSKQHFLHGLGFRAMTTQLDVFLWPMKHYRAPFFWCWVVCS